MGGSRARKHGKYTGGRPWPLVVPVCRKCRGGPPEHFYNSRGLDNICHKAERKSGNKHRWPDLPVMLRSASLAQIKKNPLRWLRNNMTDSHAKTIPPRYHELECWRIIHVVAARWYGEEVFLDPLQPFNYEDTVWSVSADSEADLNEPIYNVDEIAKQRRAKAALSKRSKNRDPLRYDHIVTIVKPTVIALAATGKDLPRPKVAIFSNGWSATWMNGNYGVAISGPLHEQPTTITICDLKGEEFTDFSYSIPDFHLVWSIFQSVATVNASDR